MKILLIILSVIFAVFVIIQLYLIRLVKNTEEQPYELVKQIDQIEIRYYPSAIIATINTDQKTYKEASSAGFRTLASFIFGNNKTNESIAMTSPVQMNMDDSMSTVSFVMPSNYKLDNLPKPNDTGISIKETEGAHFATLEFGGFASDEKIKEMGDQLFKLLDAKGIAHSNRLNFLGYNPPFQFFGRRNEVSVEVLDWKK